MTEPDSPRRVLSEDEIASTLVAIDKSGQLAGHQPATAESLDRTERILRGHTTLEEGQKELLSKYAEES